MQPSTNISTSLSSPAGSNTVLWFRSPETLTHNDVWVGMTGYLTPVWEQRYDLGFANPFTIKAQETSACTVAL